MKSINGTPLLTQLSFLPTFTQVRALPEIRTTLPSLEQEVPAFGVAAIEAERATEEKRDEKGDPPRELSIYAWR